MSEYAMHVKFVKFRKGECRTILVGLVW